MRTTPYTHDEIEAIFAGVQRLRNLVAGLSRIENELFCSLRDEQKTKVLVAMKAITDACVEHIGPDESPSVTALLFSVAAASALRKHGEMLEEFCDSMTAVIQ